MGGALRFIKKRKQLFVWPFFPLFVYGLSFSFCNLPHVKWSISAKHFDEFFQRPFFAFVGKPYG